MAVIMSNKALFLDRDGVVNEDFGYVHKKEQLKYVEGIFNLCLKASKLDYKIIIVTNQAGIGRGYYSEDDFKKFMEIIKLQFTSKGITINAVYFCPHHPKHGLNRYKKNCAFRKPNPGMIKKALTDFNLDASKCIMVGDSITDMQAGQQSGINKLFMLTNSSNIINNINCEFITNLKTVKL